MAAPPACEVREAGPAARERPTAGRSRAEKLSEFEVRLGDVLYMAEGGAAVIPGGKAPDGPRRTSASVAVSFKDVRYEVLQKKEAKQILLGISGHVASRQMLCVLGPSGSGKTSLIQILAKKITNSDRHRVSGSVLCNGRELTGSQFQRIAGLVTQEDVFNATLSVRETLKFAAMLKLPKDIQAERVNSVISMLQLEKCQATYIGDDSNPYLKGISGGEKRRLAIATEILDPRISVLVLDEPTSGLDAAAALNVAGILRTLADGGITVIATLHQPRNLIMSKFDQLMVLAAGSTSYYGALEDYVPYLRSTLQCQLPEHESPYDLLLDALNPAIGQLTGEIRAIPKDCADVAVALAELYTNSEAKKKAPGEGLAVSEASGDDFKAMLLARSSVGWFGKFCTILHRTFLIKLRDPMVMMTQVSTAIMMGLLFGMLYWGTYDKELEYAILDTQMVITMTVMFTVFMPFDVTMTFPTERKIFLRERKAGLYQTGCFYLARIMADMPMHIVAACILSLIVYPMAGLRCGFHIFVLLNVVGILVGASLMQWVGSMSRSFEEANLLMLVIMMMSMIMSTGFTRQVPKWLQWMRDVSLMGRISDLAMYYEFRNIDPKFGDPADVLDAYAVQCRNDEDVREIAFILLGVYLVARLLTYLFVKFVHTGRSFAENLRD